MYDFTNVKQYILTARKSYGIYKNIPIFIPTKEQKKIIDLSQKRLVDTNHLMEILDCGKHTAIMIGTSARARVCFERKLFWNVKLIQQYIDRIAE